MRMYLRLMLAHTIAAVLLTTSYTPAKTSPTDYAFEYMQRMYGSKNPTVPLVTYAGEVAQALALSSTSPSLSRLLYSITLASQVVDGAACFTTAIANPPKTGNPEIDKLNEPTTLSRFIHGSFGLLQLSNTPATARLLANTGALSALYEKHPKLLKSLRRISRKRVTNATISLLIYLGSRLVVGWLGKSSINGKRTDDEATQMAFSIFVSSILSALLLDTQAEENGIEEQLIEHAKRLEHENKKPARSKKEKFFTPPNMEKNTSSPRTSLSRKRFKADEVLLDLAANRELFEEITNIALDGATENK